ncbi:hypothetical protein [Pantoea endophytica]
MRERGIIFNAEMVRAVLEGRKTQTRRIMKNQPMPHPTREGDFWFRCNKALSMINVSDFTPRNGPLPDAHEYFSMCCPFGAVGDRLWVRETWMPDAPRDGTWGDVEFYGCKGSPLSMIPERYRKPEHCIHRASWEGSEMVGWTPSIHMPRWASRITLEITGVRVERLASISPDDARAEGYPVERDADGGHLDPWLWFRDLWDGIYPEHSFKANPWVWVVEFKRVEGDA